MDDHTDMSCRLTVKPARPQTSQICSRHFLKAECAELEKQNVRVVKILHPSMLH